VGEKSESTFTKTANVDVEGTPRQLPLLIRPVGGNVDLVQWLQENEDLATQSLLNHGAILFRAFNVTSATYFEQVARAVCRDLLPDNAEHTPVSENGMIQTPIFYPPDRKLLWHNENSFNLKWPLRLLFCCMRPADRGGETPLVDSRRVFSRLDPSIVRQFTDLGVMYVRNFGTGLGLSWQKVFGTGDKSHVANLCRQMNVEFEWRRDDELHTHFVRPGVIPHPITGEMSWFNQAQHWHIACGDEEMREALLEMFPEDQLPRMCYYGDGSSIDSSVMKEIMDVYQELEVSFAWEKSDVAILDNVLIAHARNPFQGERRLLVAMGEMQSFGHK